MTDNLLYMLCTFVLQENQNNKLNVTVVRVGGNLDKRWVKIQTINGMNSTVLHFISKISLSCFKFCCAFI